MSEQRQYNAGTKQKTWVGKNATNTLEKWREKNERIREARLHNIHMLSTSRERLFDYERDSIEWLINFPLFLQTHTKQYRQYRIRRRSENNYSAPQVHAHWLYPSIAAKLISSVRSEYLRCCKTRWRRKSKVSYLIFSILLCDYSIVAAKSKLLTSNLRLHWGFFSTSIFPIPIIFAQTNLNDFCLQLSQLY